MIPYRDVGQRVTPKSVLDIDELGFRYAQLPRIESEDGGSATAATATPPALGFSCALPAA